jgi:hypothetical protein
MHPGAAMPDALSIGSAKGREPVTLWLWKPGLPGETRNPRIDYINVAYPT